MKQAQLRKRTRKEREPEILAAARQLLETRGLVGSSVADVAVLAGVSEATVFNYFPTRRDLMFRVITEWMEPVIERLETDIPHIEGARARLVFFASRHLREMAVAPGMYQLIYRELHWEDYYGSVLHRLNQRYTGVMRWVIEAGREEGELRADVDTHIVRDMLFGALHHIGWRTLMNGRPLDCDAAASQIGYQLFLGMAHFSPTAPSGGTKLDDAVARLERIADRLDRKS